MVKLHRRTEAGAEVHFVIVITSRFNTNVGDAGQWRGKLVWMASSSAAPCEKRTAHPALRPCHGTLFINFAPNPPSNFSSLSFPQIFLHIFTPRACLLSLLRSLDPRKVLMLTTISAFSLITGWICKKKKKCKGVYEILKILIL